MTYPTSLMVWLVGYIMTLEFLLREHTAIKQDILQLFGTVNIQMVSINKVSMIKAFISRRINEVEKI